MYLTNGGDGGSNGVAVTAANSGGSSGTPWDSVTTGATGIYSSTQAAHGLLSYQFSSSTAGTYYGTWSTAFGSQTSFWCRLSCYFTANPAATLNIANWRVATATAAGRISISSTGKIFLTDATGTAVITSTVGLTLNAWNRIEWACTPGTTTTNGAATLQHYAADSTTLAEAAQSVSANNFGAAATTMIEYGIPISTASVTAFYLDDLGASSFGWMGPAVPRTMPPNVVNQAALIRANSW